MSAAPEYFYETEIEWTGEKDLNLSGGKRPAIAAGAPPEFQGREGNWSPEHLLVASIKSAIKIEPEVSHHQAPVSPCPLGTESGGS